MYRRWRPWHGKLAVIASILMVVLGPALRDEQQAVRVDPDLRKHFVESEALLAEEDLSLSPGRYRLDILTTGHRWRDTEMRRMMQRWNDYAGPVHYWLNQDREMVYTMSAMGLDGRHHLVNAYLEGYEPFVTDNVMIPLYALSQRKRYQLDAKNYFGKQDVWQSSRQAFYYPRGDCEDHAIILADWLIMMGEDARVVIGDWRRNRHAWVVLLRDGDEFLLEATRKSGLGRNKPFPLASLHREYEPEFMFNDEYFWMNTGSKHTTRYSGSSWERRSRFRYLD